MQHCAAAIANFSAASESVKVAGGICAAPVAAVDAANVAFEALYASFEDGLKEALPEFAFKPTAPELASAICAWVAEVSNAVQSMMSQILVADATQQKVEQWLASSFGPRDVIFKCMTTMLMCKAIFVPGDKQFEQLKKLWDITLWLGSCQRFWNGAATSQDCTGRAPPAFKATRRRRRRYLANFLWACRTMRW